MISKNEERLTRLVEILQGSYLTVQGFLNYSLEHAVQLAGSETGELYYYYKNTKKIVFDTRAKNPSLHTSQVYEFDKEGIWGGVVQKKKTIILNEFQDASKKITRFMSTPVFQSGEIVAIVDLYNKKEDYTEEDGDQVSRLMSSAWAASERLAVEEVLRRSEFFFKESQRAARIGSYNCDFESNYWESSDVLDEILGIDGSYPHTVEGWEDLIHPEDRDEVINYLQKIIVQGEKFTKEYRILRPSDNKIRWVFGVGQPAFDKTGRIRSLIGTIQDTNERHLLEDQLRELAHTDALTGIANRRFLFETAEKELKVCRRKGCDLGVIILDIDKFKIINDKCGHAAGDGALVAIVEVCKKCLRDTDLFARLGGDEFVIVLPDTSVDVVISIAERLRQVTDGVEVKELKKCDVVVSCSFGASVLRKNDTFDDLLARADDALLKSKENGRNKVCCLE